MYSFEYSSLFDPHQGSLTHLSYSFSWYSVLKAKLIFILYKTEAPLPTPLCILAHAKTQIGHTVPGQVRETRHKCLCLYTSLLAAIDTKCLYFIMQQVRCTFAIASSGGYKSSLWAATCVYIYIYIYV